MSHSWVSSQPTFDLASLDTCFSMQVIHPLKSISGTSDVTVIERGASDRRTAKEKVDIHYIVLYLTLNVGEDCNDEVGHA